MIILGCGMLIYFHSGWLPRRCLRPKKYSHDKKTLEGSATEDVPTPTVKKILEDIDKLLVIQISKFSLRKNDRDFPNLTLLLDMFGKKNELNWASLVGIFVELDFRWVDEADQILACRNDNKGALIFPMSSLKGSYGRGMTELLRKKADLRHAEVVESNIELEERNVKLVERIEALVKMTTELTDA